MYRQSRGDMQAKGFEMLTRERKERVKKCRGKRGEREAERERERERESVCV